MPLHYALLLPIAVCWILAALLCVRLPDRIRFPAVAALGLFLTGILTVLYLVANYFTGEGINEAVFFHALYGPDGIGVWQFPDVLLASVASIAVLLATSYALFRYVTRKRTQAQHPSPSHARIASTALVHGLVFFSITAHPAVIDTLQVLRNHDYVVTPESEQFAENVRPVEIALATPRPKNIIYLYAESLERTYFDEQRFPGLIRELRELERQSLSFTGVQEAVLTDWTIAGMTASQCGIPLSTFRKRNEIAPHERFLPGVTCMGDILSEYGYALSYRGGADLNFSGKGRFYTGHGFKDVRGLHELLDDLPPGEPLSYWGIFDDRLLDLFYDQFITLSRGKQPFGLFGLTLDTHAPHGHATPACRNLRYQDGENAMLNAVACADRLVARFIRRFLASPEARDTLLVVASDHLARRGGSTELLDKNGPEARRNLLMIFNSGLPPARISRSASTLDVGPTVMNLMGFQTEDLALGRSLLGPEPTLVEKLGISTLNARIERWRLNLFALESRS